MVDFGAIMLPALFDLPAVTHRRRSSVNFGGKTFARKCMCEKLIKCVAKTGFEIQSYIQRTYEMKNRILSKNKGCLFFLLPKMYQLPEY